MNVSSGGRKLLQSRRGNSLETIETDGQMLQRVMPELIGIKNILAINDEAHRCYREKQGEDNQNKLKWEERRQEEKNKEVARLWISGVQQAHKEDKIDFSSVKPWPGKLVCAEGFFEDIANEDERKSSDSSTKRAAIFIGPEFGTVSRPDLVAAVREEVESEFDVLIACAFNFDAHASEFDKLGHIRVLKARMNADLHMAQDLKNTKKGNLFVIFGEPDIRINNLGDDQIQIEIKGVDAFHPQTGEVRSDGTDGIVCWFIDTDYNEESFMVRHAYFLGNEDPYKVLKRSLKSEINQDIWATLYSDTSRPFKKPVSGRIAVKVINHLGDEVLKVYRV